MKAVVTDSELRQLLLRQLPAEAMTAIEDGLVLDDSVAERLQHQQYELLDEYARGGLTQEDRRAVEKYLLRTAAERDRVYLVEGLVRIAGQRRALGGKTFPGSRTRAFKPPTRPVLAAALAASLVLVSLLAVYRRSPSAPERTAQTGVRSTAVVPATPLPPSTPASALQQLTLLADATRSTDATELSLSAGVLGLRLQAQIQHPDAASRYRLTVTDAEGRDLFAAADLELRQADGLAYVQTLIPASAVSSGQLRVRVESQTAVGGSAAFSFTWILQTS